MGNEGSCFENWQLNPGQNINVDAVVSVNNQLVFSSTGEIHLSAKESEVLAEGELLRLFPIPRMTK